ncbi:Hypoxic response protein 1 [Planctomycetes bacterium Poly30]|uniref:Hypoxic response protein 1 n=1 Tax=Saltatorellus ferox TaxID=2528018 RepID=A0A518EL37_9BACT|nr:Hypoxic response protein 1 [Planctomycetes bacterium Poly30]
MTALEHQKIIDLASAPIRIGAEATLDAAARLMAQSHVGSLVVDVDGEPVGLITDRDVALAGLLRAEGTPLPSVREAASMPLLTLPANVSIEEAARFFGEHCVRRVGLVSMKGTLVGILSSDTVLTFTATILRTLAEGIERGLSEERDPRGGAPSNLGTE